MAEMMKVQFLLQAFMVDNDVGERAATIFRLTMANEHCLHMSPVEQTELVSTYRWTLDDASIIGVPNIEEQAAAKAFALALTVQFWRTLHSPVVVNTVSELEVEKAGLVGEVSTRLTSRPITIDEAAFVGAAKALSNGWAMKGSRGRVVREAVNSYWDALHSVHRRSRYQHLWAAFEKLVNIDARNRTGGKFDTHAAGVTDVESTHIEPLRDLNRWLKHPDGMRKLPPEVAENIGQDAGKLKRLLDRSLSNRLSFPLSGTYAQ